MLVCPLAIWPQFPFCLFPVSSHLFASCPRAPSLFSPSLSVCGCVWVCWCVSLGCPLCQGNMTGRKLPQTLSLPLITSRHTLATSGIYATCFMGRVYLENGATISCKRPVCDEAGAVESERGFCLFPPFRVLMHRWYVM